MINKKRIRIGLSITEKILNDIDETVSEMGMNRSAFITFVCKQYMDQQKALKISQDMQSLQTKEGMEQMYHIAKKIEEESKL